MDLKNAAKHFVVIKFFQIKKKFLCLRNSTPVTSWSSWRNLTDKRPLWLSFSCSRKGGRALDAGSGLHPDGVRLVGGPQTKLSSMLEQSRKESTSRGLISCCWSAASMLSGQPAASLRRAAWKTHSWSGRDPVLLISTSAAQELEFDILMV